MICVGRGCDREDIHGRGLCGKHYQQRTKAGTLKSAPTLTRLGVAERFWAAIDRAGPIPAHMPHLGPCWIWTAQLSPKGYGRFSYPGGIQAHRFAWELDRGAIPEGFCVLHHCDNRRCVNPAHLFVGTVADNNADREAKGRTKVPKLRGHRHPNAKLTEAAVLAIRTEYATGGVTQRELAQRYDIAPSVVARVLLRQIWTHV